MANGDGNENANWRIASEGEIERGREGGARVRLKAKRKEENEQQAKRITIFSPFVFAPRNTFCCHNSQAQEEGEQ